MEKENWIEVAKVDEVPLDGTYLVWVDDEPVALYNLEGSIYATHDTCTHGSGSLSEGYVCGQNIECPLHQGLFHIPSGKAVGVPCVENILTYSIFVDSGIVYLKR